ncbi:MAG TPA: OmpW family outer membrane protein [Caulobacteraceae bacterium]|nr:OmpW family outer membrane protein [Caulobacteraceae bacterium]
MKTLLLAASAALAMTAATTAQADDFQPEQAGHWMLNVRVTDVAPAANSSINTAAGAASGLKVQVSQSVVPTLGLNYFFTNNLAIEIIAGASDHTIKAQGPGTNVAVHDTWVLPPVVALQYHFLPDQRISPYVGAGVNYMIFFAGQDKYGFKVKVPDGFGGAVQGGVDVALSGRWSANVDVKKVFFRTDASINNGTLKSTVNLDPLVVSAGLGYRF